MTKGTTLYRAPTPLEKEHAETLKEWQEATPRLLKFHVLQEGENIASCELFLRKDVYGSFVATFKVVVKRANGKMESFEAPATKATLTRAIDRARRVLMARIGGLTNYR